MPIGLNVSNFKDIRNSSCFKIMHLPSKPGLLLLLIKLILLIPGRFFSETNGFPEAPLSLYYSELGCCIKFFHFDQLGHGCRP